MPPTTGHAEDQLQRRFGDELHDDERPVGGGDERAALEGRLQGRSVRHRHIPVYLCGILLDEWLCPFPATAPAVPASGRSLQPVSWRRLLVAGLTAAALAGLAGVALERWWLGPTDATAAARVESLVRREFDGMTAALAEVATAIAANPAARELAAGPEAARSPLRPAGERARRRARTPTTSRSRSTTPSERGPRLERTALRHSPRAHRRSPGSLRDAFGARPAPGARSAHRQQRAGWRCRSRRRPGRRSATGAASARSRSSTSSRARRPGAAIAPVEDSLPTSIAPVSLRPRSEGAGEAPRDGSVSPAHAGGCAARRRVRRAGRRAEGARGLARERSPAGSS